MTETTLSTTHMPELDRMAAGSDMFETGQLATLSKHRHATILKDVARHGHFCGITPIRVGRKHLWPVNQVRQLLSDGV